MANSEHERKKSVLDLLSSPEVLSSLVAGGFAGAVAKSVIAPLERTKINFQVSERRYSFLAAYRFLIHTANVDGLRMLWRGNTATMVRIIPYAACQFSSHEFWKRILARFGRPPEARPDGSLVLPPLRRFCAGSLAGVTAVSLTFPLDTARTRMAVTKRDKYRSIFDVFVKTKREEGILCLYRGISATLIGQIPYAGIAFFTFETCKKKCADMGIQVTPLHRLVFGGCAGLLGQASCYPLDIVRRRMQSAGM